MTAGVTSGWEYLTINFYELPLAAQISDALNDVGKDGWELVKITANEVAYFKRPIGRDAPAKRTTRKALPRG
jgi:hypothetical protein